ncbi:MAG: alanine dehydrogenase [Bacteroidetes bacterium]|nr:alanine dehydrogenase [Bacteroidota bacterium]
MSVSTIKLGIVREEKNPPDKRVPFTPLQCTELLKEYPNLEIYIQPSTIRSYEDSEYLGFGLTLQEDLSNCDILMGVKEIPIDKLIPNKKYFFFSHTIKKQPHNKKLLQAIIQKGITLVDYETLTDKEHNRLIGFGRYAGIVGAYNGLLGYGKKYDLFHIKPANKCRDRAEIEEELKRVKLPNIKILITGGGRVANGCVETVSSLKIRKVTPYEFLHNSYREPVYCQLHSKDYYSAKDGSSWNMKDFYLHPDSYVSNFVPYTKVCDLLITGHFWDSRTPALFTKDNMRSSDFRISVIADVTCDINGSIPSTVRASTINEPFYGYNPTTEQEDIPFRNHSVTVMAVDNLPCELPRDASEDFGKELLNGIMPSLFREDKEGIIERATIASNGKLMERFTYLSDYIA